jgi:hypothetical protein
MGLKLNFTPSQEIEGNYEVINTVSPLLIHTKIGDVDLSNITLAQAHALYAAGTDYLKPVKAKADSKK